ncbi:MAG: pyruvate formate-lyase-activating protein [Rikenellaceae bacterium]
MKIHSFESFGTVDGPGIRFVVFTQGCPLRCLYCHNPDTWSCENAPKEMSARLVMDEILKYRNFIKKGGVTISGGEPLMQAVEIKQLFELCKADGIHTALDTSGIILNDKVKELLKFTDLVLLDIKSIDELQYEQITGKSLLSKTLQFLDYLEENQIKTWIRHVVVPTLTDSDELIEKLSNHLKPYKMVEKVELLPYHNLGITKYESLGIDYPLKDIEPLSKSRIEELNKLYFND